MRVRIEHPVCGCVLQGGGGGQQGHLSLCDRSHVPGSWGPAGPLPRPCHSCCCPSASLWHQRVNARLSLARVSHPGVVAGYLSSDVSRVTVSRGAKNTPSCVRLCMCRGKPAEGRRGFTTTLLMMEKQTRAIRRQQTVHQCACHADGSEKSLFQIMPSFSGSLMCKMAACDQMYSTHTQGCLVSLNILWVNHSQPWGSAVCLRKDLSFLIWSL